ncbi:MAG TPA: MFS transporter [Kofleriaceae bacterium]|jgi:MFS family permease
MSARRGVWQFPNFVRSWLALAISTYGARITRTALPIIAITLLHQPESIIGVLVAGQLAPGIVLALFSGGFVDRTDKRLILVWADIIRAAAIVSPTIAWMTGALTVAHLFVVGAIVGAASAMFHITDTAYLPTLVGTELVGDGNAVIEATEGVAEIVGPASAGALIAMLGAPLAVAIDAVTYLWSALFLVRIKPPFAEPPRAQPPVKARVSLREDLAIGMRALFGNAIVRPITIAYMLWSLWGGFFMTLYAPFLLRDLHLGETWFGVIVAMGGVGALFGAVFSRASVKRFGLGNTIIVSSALSLAAGLFVPAARGSSVMVIAFLVAHQILADGFSVAFVVQETTLRQTVIPTEILGRANAAFHVCTQVPLPIGALVGGALASALGTRTALWIGITIGLLPPLLMWPLRRVREIPPTSDSVAVRCPTTRTDRPPTRCVERRTRRRSRRCA